MGVEVERANVQIGYVMLNVLGLREHNRLCDLLAKKIIQLGTTNACSKPREIFCSLRFWELCEDYVNHITPYHFKFSQIHSHLVMKNGIARIGWIYFSLSLA